MLNAFNRLLAALPPEQRQPYYLHLAQRALEAYDLAAVTPIFLQHNAAVTYRIDDAGAPRFLLKLHVPAGDSLPAAPAQLRASLHWLQQLGLSPTLDLPIPVANRAGALLSSLTVDGLADPVWCSLQQWVAGEHVRGDFSMHQLTQLGVMMATLHAASRQQRAATAALPRFDVAWISECVAELRPAVALGLLTPAEFRVIERTGPRLHERWVRDPPTTDVWGAIHGDLHHGNMVFLHDMARPIDFDGLHVAPFVFDLGTTLYHVYYQGAAAQQALLAGYRSTAVRKAWSNADLDGALIWAALSNLAFQMSLPDQRASAHLKRNLRQLANEFCTVVLAGRPIVAA